MRLIDADELMNDMLHITTIDGNIPLKVVIAAIWEAPTAKRTGWISVKDRMPPNDDTKVLTYGDPVTHWMPLPEPPKEVK